MTISSIGKRSCRANRRGGSVSQPRSTIGFIQIIEPEIEETHYPAEFGAGLRTIDVRIGEAAGLGRAHGTLSMRPALERCFVEPTVEAVLVDLPAASHRVRRCRERLGVRRTGRRRLGADDGWIYRVESNELLPPTRA